MLVSLSVELREALSSRSPNTALGTAGPPKLVEIILLKQLLTQPPPEIFSTGRLRAPLTFKRLKRDRSFR